VVLENTLLHVFGGQGYFRCTNSASSVTLDGLVQMVPRSLSKSHVFLFDIRTLELCMTELVYADVFCIPVSTHVTFKLVMQSLFYCFLCSITYLELFLFPESVFIVRQCQEIFLEEIRSWEIPQPVLAPILWMPCCCHESWPQYFGCPAAATNIWILILLLVYYIFNSIFYSSSWSNYWHRKRHTSLSTQFLKLIS
jgi:hypothetical protein